MLSLKIFLGSGIVLQYGFIDFYLSKFLSSDQNANSNITDVDLHSSIKNLIRNLNKEYLFIYDPSQEFN